MPTDTRTRVLIVEDEQNLADLYELWLADGYEVRTAYSGEAAMESVADRGADVVLLDRRMPELSGDEVAHRLDERGLNAQVIMITATSPQPEIAELPIDEYVMKPVNRDELRAVVETAELVATYDEQVTELFALTARQHALRQEVPEDELQASDEFIRLNSRITELNESLDGAIEELRPQLEVDAFARIAGDVSGKQNRENAK